MRSFLPFWRRLARALGLKPIDRERRFRQSLRRLRQTPLCLEQLEPRLLLTATVTLDVSPASVDENGSSNIVYTFTRTGSTEFSSYANFSVGGTAAYFYDYSQSGASSFGSTGYVIFAAGYSTATVTIDPSGDSVVELNETVSLTLTTGPYNIGTSGAVTATINNDDSATITISDVTANENSFGFSSFTVTLSAPVGSSITVDYATAVNTAGDGTGGTDNDFTAKTGTLTFQNF